MNFFQHIILFFILLNPFFSSPFTSFPVFNPNQKIDLHYPSNVVAEISELYGIDSLLAFSLIDIESNWDSMAVSTEGCKGLWQLNEKYFPVEDIFTVEVNTNWGASYLRYLLDTFPDTLQALTAYNFGPNHKQTATGTSQYAQKVYLNYLSKCKLRGKRSSAPCVALDSCPILVSLY